MEDYIVSFDSLESGVFFLWLHDADELSIMKDQLGYLMISSDRICIKSSKSGYYLNASPWEGECELTQEEAQQKVVPVVPAHMLIKRTKN